VAVAYAAFSDAGSPLTATTTAQAYTPASAMKLISVDNVGSARIFVRVNTTTGSFSTATAIPIDNGKSFTFNYGLEETIHNLIYATTNSTSEILVGGY